MLAHPSASQTRNNNSCHIHLHTYELTHTHTHTHRIRQNSQRERVCRCAFVCESLEAFELEEKLSPLSIEKTRGRDDSNGHIIRSSRAYNRGIRITRGVRHEATRDEAVT